MTRVSIVIPCFNGGDVIRDAVASALAQSHPDVEVIVVDDGSTDIETLEALSQIDVAGSVRVVHQANQGPSAARNRAIEEATGDYILPLDHDDEFYPQYVAKAAAVLDEQADVGIVYARVERFGASSGEWPLAAFTIGKMLIGNVIHASAMFRRDDWAQVGGYSRELRSGHEDYEFWLRILGLGRHAVRLDEILFRYRDTDSSFSKVMSRQDRIDAFAHSFRSNAALYTTHAEAYAEALVDEQDTRGNMLAHYKHRYGKVEDVVARLGALRNRVRPKKAPSSEP